MKNNGGSTCQKEEKILKCVRSLEIQDDTVFINLTRFEGF